MADADLDEFDGGRDGTVGARSSPDAKTSRRGDSSVLVQMVEDRTEKEPPPAPSIEYPASGDVLTEDQVQLRGSATPGSVLCIVDWLSPVATARAAADGTWSATLEHVPTGNHAYQATLVNARGAILVASKPSIVTVTLPEVAPRKRQRGRREEAEAPTVTSPRRDATPAVKAAAAREQPAPEEETGAKPEIKEKADRRPLSGILAVVVTVVIVAGGVLYHFLGQNIGVRAHRVAIHVAAQTQSGPPQKQSPKGQPKPKPTALPLQGVSAWDFPPLRASASQVMLVLTNQGRRAISARIKVDGTVEKIHIPARNGAEIAMNPREAQGRIEVSASGPVMVQRLVVRGASVHTTDGTPTVASSAKR